MSRKIVHSLIAKEKDASSINQFPRINLLNAEGKNFLSIIAERMTIEMQQNNLIDTPVQKGGIRRLPRSLEHTRMI